VGLMEPGFGVRFPVGGAGDRALAAVERERSGKRALVDGARFEKDLRITTHDQHLLDDGALDACAIARRERRGSEHAQRRGIEARLDGARRAIDLDGEAGHVELEVVGDGGEDPFLESEDPAARRLRVETIHTKRIEHGTRRMSSMKTIWVSLFLVARA